MKKYFLITITALMAVMVWSCKKDKNGDDFNDNSNPDPNGPPWGIELTIENIIGQGPFFFRVAGAGTFTIDWGDGTKQENMQMPQLEEVPEDVDVYSFTAFSHKYEYGGPYQVKVFGQGGVTLFNVNNAIDCSSLLLDNCSQLKYLNCRYNQLTSLDISGCSQLKYLDCRHNLLTSLDISNCPQLRKLDCGENLLTSLDVSGCTKLKRLECYINQLSAVAMNKIYFDLPPRPQSDGALVIDKQNASNYAIAERKGWSVCFHKF